MASGLTLRRAAGYLAALPCLWGLFLTRLWAVFIGHISGKVIALAALLFAAAVVYLACLCRAERLLKPFQNGLTNLLIAGIAFLAGGLLDVSYVMVDATGTLLAHPVFHALTTLGSGLVCAVLALALCTAARAWGKVEAGSPWQMLALFVLVNGLTIFYVAGSSTVYVWDNAGYWSVARTLAQQPFGLAQLREAVATTVTLDYNYLLALPISWVMRLLGGSRAVFLFSIVNLYLLPALWGLCVLGRRWRWGGLWLALLFPALTYLALVGFVDVAAAGAAIWAVAIYTRPDAPGWARGLLAGALLTLTFLLRRYFLFFALAFGVGALIEALLRCNKSSLTAFGTLFWSTAVTSLYAAQAFLVDKLTTRYGDLYSAYDLGLRSDVVLFARYFGLIVLIFAVVLGLFRLIRYKKERGQMALALVTLAVCFFLVTRVQSHGQQHTLMYLPALALLLAPGNAGKSAADQRMQSLPKADEKRTMGGWNADGRWVALGCRGMAWVLAAVCTLVGLLPRTQPNSLTEITTPDLLPGFSFHGPRRGDTDDLLALSDYLDGRASVAEGQATCAVFASSLLLNTETLLNLRPSLNLPEPWPKMAYIYTASVDKRDAFTWAALDADYLVVGDPVQVHLGEENQQVVTLAARAVLDGVGLGAAFERENVSFTLENGDKVYVYRRVRDVTVEEKEALSQALAARYPDYAQLYQVP